MFEKINLLKVTTLHTFQPLVHVQTLLWAVDFFSFLPKDRNQIHPSRTNVSFEDELKND